MDIDSWMAKQNFVLLVYTLQNCIALKMTPKEFVRQTRVDGASTLNGQHPLSRKTGSKHSFILATRQCGFMAFRWHHRTMRLADGKRIFCRPQLPDVFLF